jgi:hypothetical protein
VRKNNMKSISICLGFAMMASVASTCAAHQEEREGERVPVVFSGGHDTDPRDHGRPVVLVAAGLGVTPEVFRDAFSRVQPAPAGREPDPAQVRRNKEALLGALAKYGVTNDLLDRVSNQYRYNPGRGELWPVKEASAYAIVRNGKVVRVVVTAGGSGYSSPPSISVKGVRLQATVKLAFGKDLANNGSIASIALPASR